eukprot:TRINITY_DN13848_c0_g1_i3.p1 TRINITY_DN13848_c0_g1~~TRINITY_DN13848_c0_g1_i3.p1  ORF type:complete len:802 (-),score=115.63 TRINITY_DN13848_c0_g1_i3:91-2496(-)
MVKNQIYSMMLCLISWLLISQLQTCLAQSKTSQQSTPDVCEVWKNSDNANYSYFLEISVEQGLYFCSGILVEEDWLLMSYSCFLRIVNYAADTSRPEIKSSDPPVLQSFFENTNCFDIQNLGGTQIQIKSVAGNCVNGTSDREFGLYTIPLFGVIYDSYYTEKIEFIDNFTQINSNVDNINATNVDVHVNDLLLLKLQDKFSDVPLELVKRSPFNFNNQEVKYEIYLQVQIEGNQYLIFGQTNVTSEKSNKNNFQCSNSPNFEDVLCEQNQQICKDQTYICGQFEMPDLGGMYAYQLQSGDPLVRKQDSMEAEIFGFITTDCIPPSYRTYYHSFSNEFYAYKFGDYSFDSNGAVFVSFTEQNLNWINKITKQYTENQCTDIPQIDVEVVVEKEDVEIVKIIVPVIVCGVLIIAAVAIFIRWRITKGSQDDQDANLIIAAESGSRGVYRSRLDQIEMIGLGEVSTIYDKDKDSAFNSPPNWWSGIQLPEGVRDIPLSDLIGIQQLGAGGFAVVYQAEFEEKAKERYGDLGKQQVAVKIVYKEYMQIKHSMAAILKEVAAMNRLDSQYIVKMLGASLVIRPSIVLELVPHGCLEKLLSKDGYRCHQTTLAWKLKLMLNISKGIQYLHSENVIHRDLKPANILIQDPQNAHTKITDFGLAKIKQTASSVISKPFAGTVQYMAPEMYEKQENIDEKVDIWALGIVMQYIVRGVVPWEGQDENFIVCRVSVHKEAPDQGELPDDCPQELSQLIRSCWLEKDWRPSADYIVHKLQYILQQNSMRSNSNNNQQIQQFIQLTQIKNFFS